MSWWTRGARHFLAFFGAYLVLYWSKGFLTDTADPRRLRPNLTKVGVKSYANTAAASVGQREAPLTHSSSATYSYFAAEVSSSTTVVIAAAVWAQWHNIKLHKIRLRGQQAWPPTVQQESSHPLQARRRHKALKNEQNSDPRGGRRARPRRGLLLDYWQRKDGRRQGLRRHKIS